MTACVNNQNENKGGVSHKVLRSVVAGAMAVSMVPSVALADTVTTESEVAPLAVTSAQDFSNGAVTAAVDGNNNAVSINQSVEWTADGKAHYLVPTQVTTDEGKDVIDLTSEENKGNYSISYYKADDNGTANVPAIVDEDNEQIKVTSVSENQITAVGTYYAVVNAVGGYYNGGSVAIEFSIVAKSLKDAELYQVVAKDGVVDLTDFSDTEYVFTNESWKFGDQEGELALQLNGENLDINMYNVKIYKKGTGTDVNNNGTLYAGDYVAKIEGRDGTVYAGSKRDINFTIKAFDISKANIVIDTIEIGDFASANYKPVIASIDGDDSSALKNVIKLDFKSSPDGTTTQLGKYTYTAKYDEDAEAALNSVTGTKDVSFDVVATQATKAVIDFGNDELKTAGEVNLSEGESFDLSEIKVTANNKELADDQYTVTVVDQQTGEVADINKAGKYTVKVEVIPSKCDYAVVGSAEQNVWVYNGVVTASNDVYFKFDGKVAGQNETVVYDGTDQLKKLQVVVKTEKGEKVLVEGVDYKVETKADNKIVTEAVNADTYAVTVTSDTWKGFNPETFTLTVDTVKPVSIRVAGLKTVYTSSVNSNGETEYAAVTGLPYTGSEIVPVLEYTIDSKCTGAADNEVEWKVLPAENYKLTYTYDSESASLKDACEDGKWYTVTFAEQYVEVDNYTLSNFNGSNTISALGGARGKLFVIDETCFNDVKAADWYATAASQSASLGYFSGVEGGLFLPAKSLTRAEAIQVLYAMSGAEIHWTDYAKYKQIADEAFDDVDASAWYAVQLGWAKEAGLVSGDDQGNFNPGQEINREQFAVMLANYASKFGTYEAADMKVLEDYADADSISSWAKAALAWAVENAVMGANDTLTPQATISRAETATMVVNFQPKQR